MEDINSLELGYKYQDKVLYEVRDNVSISNLDEVALMRADQIHDIIESDPLLQAQKGKWYKMTTEEKVKFAQDISDKLLLYCL